MLAAVIAENNFKNVFKSLRKIRYSKTDVIELRLDYIKDIEIGKLKNLIENCEIPLIITNRKIGEGGKLHKNEEERIQLLRKSIDFGADYIDIEYSTGKSKVKELIDNKKNAKIIVSYHNFKNTQNDINTYYDQIKKFNPDLIKIVTYANSVEDNFKIFDLIKRAENDKEKIIAFCMGSYGQFSRVLSVVLGSRITYGSTTSGMESADGQLGLVDLDETYRIKKLNTYTKILGLIGNPVDHSWSHLIHNEALDKLNLNAVYLKFKVDKLEKFINYFKGLNILGFSVTIPHKIEIMKYLDEVDKMSKGIGAVNTVVAKNGKLIGYNTDCEGAMKSLKAKTNLRNKKIVILGAGGSARALAYGLNNQKSKVIILNRTLKKSKSLAAFFDCDYGAFSDLRNMEYDILINTTPVGMFPEINKCPISPEHILENRIVFDIVFNPYKTLLLRYAEKKGCVAIPGLEMLINGAVLQFKLWTNKNAPEQLIRKKLLNHMKNDHNKN